MDLEELRKHEDNLISARVNIFLLIHTVLIAAISVSQQPIKIIFCFICFGIVLSLFWLSIGVRQWALMNWYTDKIINDSSSSSANIVNIHKDLIDWKKKNIWYRIAGQNCEFRALTIMCCYLPILFILFYLFMIIFVRC